MPDPSTARAVVDHAGVSVADLERSERFWREVLGFEMVEDRFAFPEHDLRGVVLVNVQGDDAEAERTLQGLDAAKNYVRHALVERLGLRRPPELFFQIDRSDQLGSRVDELLARAEKRHKK